MGILFFRVACFATFAAQIGRALYVALTALFVLGYYLVFILAPRSIAAGGTSRRGWIVRFALYLAGVLLNGATLLFQARQRLRKFNLDFLDNRNSAQYNSYDFGISTKLHVKLCVRLAREPESGGLFVYPWSGFPIAIE